MEKPIIFLSHISEEKALAKYVQEFIEKNFLSLVNVFVSSDDKSINLGEKWLNKISSALENSKIEFILCSPHSIKRPWINFEAGAGWVRKIKVIPLCHSGLSVNDLPFPLNCLQAINLDEISGLKLLIPTVANLLGSDEPTPDYDSFIIKVKEFEEEYTFWEKANEIFKIINSYDKEIIPELKKLKSGSTFKINIRDDGVNYFASLIQFLEKHNVLKINTRLAAASGPDGTYYLCHLILLEKFHDIINNKKFNV